MAFGQFVKTFVLKYLIHIMPFTNILSNEVQKKFAPTIFLISLLCIEPLFFKIQVKRKGKSYKIDIYTELSEDCISFLHSRCSLKIIFHKIFV